MADEVTAAEPVKPAFRTEKRQIEVDTPVARFTLDEYEVENAARLLVRQRLSNAELVRLHDIKLTEIVRQDTFSGYEVVVTLKPETQS